MILAIAAFHEDALRTQAPCLRTRHCRVDAKGTRLIRRRRYNAAPSRTAHHDRLAPQRGIVTLLYRGKEGIEIGVDNPTRRHCVSLRSSNRLFLLS